MLILLISYNQGWHTCSCLFSTCKNIPAPKEGVHINLGLRKEKIWTKKCFGSGT